MKTELQKRVQACQFPGIENAYIVISARWKNKECDIIEKCMSFMYVADENIVVEWEPEYGPITVIEKCSEDWKGEYDHEKSHPHWWFDFCKGYGSWAQLVVDERRLKERYVNGNYEYIFAVLKEFAY